MPACSRRSPRLSQCNRTNWMHYGTVSTGSGPTGYHGSLGETNSSRTRSRVFLILTNLAAVGGMVWTLRDAHLGELRDDLATMNWWWVGVAVAANLAVYVWQGLRWSLVLRPVVQVKLWQAVQSI